MSTTKSKKVEQGEHTRAALIAVARRLFAERGFSATPTEEIVRTAEVTRGALYHHFRDKEDLFRAVFESIEAELAERCVAAAMTGRDPMNCLEKGLDAFLDRCLEPDVQRIVLMDGLSVLGWDTWIEIDERYALGTVVAGLEEAMRAGQMERQPVETLAHVLLGAMTQAGMLIARSDDPVKARKTTGKVLRRLLDGLRSS